MEQRLVNRARASPDAVAVFDGDFKVSYRELIERADVLARKLDKELLDIGEPICILLEPGYKQILGQVAVLRSGSTCVPVDPSMPSLRLSNMLHDIGCRYIITKGPVGQDLSGFKIISIEDAVISTSLVTCDEISVWSGCSDSHRSHILFTSGSTGRPKPIEILARGILHVLDSFPLSPLSHMDLVSGFVNPGFDLSLFEIWGALLSGATFVRVPQEVVTDPPALSDLLKRRKVTVSIIPTALFNAIALTVPTAFRSLRHVLVCGEAAKTPAVKKVLEAEPPANLWNAYGPTEATIYVTMARIDLAETQRSRISIGEPLGQTKIYLLDEECRPITDEERWGEISIAGPQLSVGYLNRPKENKEHFVDVDASQLDELGLTVRLYRTGDIGQWRHGSRVLEFVGRADKQIKRSGHRIELGDIERTLETHPKVSSCVVVHEKQDTSEKLKGYAILASNSCDGFSDLDEIYEHAKSSLPPYMVPDSLEKLEEFPLSSTGKVDRNALLLNRHRPEPKQNKMDTNPTYSDDSKNWLRASIQDLLGVLHISGKENVFSLGLTSLQAAQLLGQIRQHSGNAVPLADLMARPTLESLQSLLDQSYAPKSEPDQRTRWVQDTCLADDILSLPDWQSQAEGRVFLTGVTGFVGAHLLDRLLSMPTVKEVACLTRSQGELSPTARISHNMEKYDLWDENRELMHKVIILEGELTDDRLGLGESQFQWLADWASVIFHAGARVNWVEPYEAHFGPNVIGTRNIIRLAATGRWKGLHYLSSIDTFNVTGFVNKIERVFEDESLQPHLESLPYDMGYAQSQWVADEMVLRARARGLPTAIYRPGFIIGDSQRAIGNPDDFFARWIMGCIQSQCWPYLPNQCLEWTTVDYVCAAMLHIATKNENLGHAYHIVSPDHSLAVSAEGLYRLLIQAGYCVDQVPYAEWVDKTSKTSGTPLEPMFPLLQEQVLGRYTRIETSMQTPIYDTTNLERALADRPDIKYTPLDADLLRRHVNCWIQRGYHHLSQGCNGHDEL